MLYYLDLPDVLTSDEFDDDHTKENNEHKRKHTEETVHQVKKIVPWFFVDMLPGVDCMMVCVHGEEASSIINELSIICIIDKTYFGYY